MSHPNQDPNPIPGKPSGGAMRQLALATELPFLVAGGALVGGLIGYGLDHWLHTKPYLMIIVGALGFFVGVRDMLRRLERSDSGVPPTQ
jgi:ATP synthase protein I